MEDLIRRADAIKAEADRVYEVLHPAGCIESYEDCLKDAVKTFKDIPSAEKQGEWIPCSERLPNEGEVVLVCMRIESYKAEWEEQRSIEFGRISSDRYDYYETGWEWLNESGADYWQADWNNSILAWMPLPKPWEGADDEAD